MYTYVHVIQRSVACDEHILCASLCMRMAYDDDDDTHIRTYADILLYICAHRSIAIRGDPAHRSRLAYML